MAGANWPLSPWPFPRNSTTFLPALLLLLVGTTTFAQPAIWLIDPPARLLENGPGTQRLPERTCPTPSTGQDPLSSVPAGVPFRVQWHDPEQLPVDLAKLELFSSDSGHLLARLENLEGGGGPGENGSVSTIAQIPAGLHCASCVLRLSVELDERIQLLSCAQVRVQPVQLEGAEPAECAANADCGGGGGGGQCLAGQCFCRAGLYGERCGKANSVAASSIVPPSPQSVRFSSSRSQFHWLASPAENALRLGLTIPSGVPGPRWFILGLQSMAEDPKCQLAMDQWKQRFSQGQIGAGEEAARAEAGVLIRVEQDKGQNVLLTGGDDFKADGEAGKRPTKLNIHRLVDNGTIGGALVCGPNQRLEQCPEMGRECEPSCEWTAQPDSIPACPPRPAAERGCGQARCVCTEGFVRLGNHLDECKPFGFCQAPEVTAVTFGGDESTTLAAAAGQSCGRNETWEKCGNACEPSCASMYSEAPCGAACEAAGCTCADNFVRAQPGGQCIQWSECPNLKERIGSVNSSKKAQGGSGEETDDGKEEIGESTTEKAPSPCGVNETLNECGRECEADCESIFERPECQLCGRPACSCRQGYARRNGQCIYWGDCPTVSIAASSSPSSSLPSSVPSSSSPTTIRSGAPPKHSGQAGLSSSPTTTTTTAATASSTRPKSPPANADEPPPMDICRSQWSWPNGCSGQKCLYTVQWHLDENMDSIQFTLDTRPAVSRKMPSGSLIWSGLGFSPSGTLLDADMIVIEATDNGNGGGGGAKGGEPRLLDMHVDEQLEQLRLDQQQDVVGTAHFSGGLMTAKFARKRRTGDAAGEDMDFGEEGNCFRFLFPVSGGRFEQSGNTSVPVADSLYASDAEICVRSCKLVKEEKEVTMMKKEEKEESSNCQKEFRWPEGCREEQCEYRAQWAWEEAGDTVQFNISSRGIGRWTGIGFSRDGRMAGSDIVTGWVYDQRAYILDRFAHAQQQPAIDPLGRQDIFDIGGALEDDVQTISFRRKVVTADHSTDLPLAGTDQCPHFLFPVQGGRVLARSSRDFQQANTPIGFHDQQQPIASAKRICLCERPKTAAAPPPQRKIGRAKRAAAAAVEEEGDGGGSGGPPYQCADIALIQVLPGAQPHQPPFVRLVDAFGLSNDSLRRDELWGGRQSFEGGIEVVQEKDNQMMTIWVRKTLKDLSNGNADLTVERGQIPVFLASGQGPVAEMDKAERLEFAMVDLMAGAGEIGGREGRPPASASSPITTVGVVVVSSTKTAPPASTTNSIGTTESSGQPARSSTGGGNQVEPATLEPTDGDANSGTSAADVQPPQPMPAPAFQPPSSSIDQQPGPPPEIVMDENCFGGFAYPEGCMLGAGQQQEEGQCQYTLEWLVQPEEAKVHFQLNARMPADHWTGVGFSKDGAMVNADALVVLLLADGQVSVQDQFSPGYGRPSIDLRQSIEAVSSRSLDGLWSVNFTRPLNTGDRQQDADLLAECHHFLFLHSANPLVSGGDGQLRKHVQTPVISENPICLGKCGQKSGGSPAMAPPTTPVVDDDGGHSSGSKERTERPEQETSRTTEEQQQPTRTTTTTTTTAQPSSSSTIVVEDKKKPTEDVPPVVHVAGQKPKKPAKEEEEEKVFNVAIRMPNERWDPKLEDMESKEFVQMEQKLKASLNALIAARWPGLVSIQVQKFAEGSVLALLQLRFNGTSNQMPADGRELKEFLQESAAQGMAAELILDREMLEVQEERAAGDGEEEEDKWGPLREVQGWALAILGLILLIAIVAALLFCAFRRTRQRRHHRRTFMTKQQAPMMMQNGAYNGGVVSSGYQQGQYAPFPCEKDRESDTTTAKTSTTNGGHAGGGGQGKGAATARRTETPRGIGEATYREWFNKVASKEAPSHYQEHWQMPPPPTPLPRAGGGGGGVMPASSPYLSYPNDPSFYTLNGEHRIVPPPPAYYRPF